MCIRDRPAGLPLPGRIHAPSGGPHRHGRPPCDILNVSITEMGPQDLAGGRLRQRAPTPPPDDIVPATAGGKASDRSRKSVSDHGGGTRVNKRQIRDGVYWMGAVDWERRLFDALIPLPDGTTYNAYLVEGTEKVALLDTVDPAQTDTLLEQLAGVPRIDYLVSHHAEQDHSGLSLIHISEPT